MVRPRKRGWQIHPATQPQGKEAAIPEVAVVADGGDPAAQRGLGQRVPSPRPPRRPRGGPGWRPAQRWRRRPGGHGCRPLGQQGGTRQVDHLSGALWGPTRRIRRRRSCCPRSPPPDRGSAQSPCHRTARRPAVAVRRSRSPGPAVVMAASLARVARPAAVEAVNLIEPFRLTTGRRAARRSQ